MGRHEITNVFVNGDMIFIGDRTEEFVIIDNILVKYNGNDEKVVISDNIKELYLLLFAAKKMREISLPDSVKVIRARVFEDCRNLNSITIPDGVKVLENATFLRCWKLKNIYLPSSLEKISDGVFWECKNLEDVIIPNNVISIGKEAFIRCQNLCSIRLPDAIKEIGDNCFEGCNKLKEIVISEKIKKIGKNICPKSTKIYVVIDGVPTSYIDKELHYANQYNEELDISKIQDGQTEIQPLEKTDIEVGKIGRIKTLRILKLLTKTDESLWIDYARYAEGKYLKPLFSQMKKWEKPKKDQKKEKHDKVLLAHVRGALLLNESKEASQYFEQ